MAAIIIPAIAASESKVNFMATLGFTAGRPESERLYKLMKEEAVREYRSVVQDKRAMSSAYQLQDPTQPRYAYTEIDKTAIHKAITSIYDRAGAETKALYDRGMDPGGTTDSNWIIRWMLYHCFRYRDGRNKRPVVSVVQDEKDWHDGKDGGCAKDHVPRFLGPSDSSAKFYAEPPPPPQPLRRPQVSSQAITNETSRRSVARPLPYDPVRA